MERFDKIEVNSGANLLFILMATIIHANSIYVQDNGVVELGYRKIISLCRRYA